MKVLVTGGAGYIGSHTVLCLLEAGHVVVVLDNLANSSVESLNRVEELTGKHPTFIELDLLDAAGVDALFAREDIDAVIHFAGLKAVGESVAEPLRYYQNNIIGTLNLLASMDKHGVRTIVFSSSATVYGASEEVPLIEKMPLDATNPYGRTKEQVEDILTDLGAADPTWRVALLRYFNPVGAHESGRIGEDPTGVPNNLLPFVARLSHARRHRCPRLHPRHGPGRWPLGCTGLPARAPGSFSLEPWHGQWVVRFGSHRGLWGGRGQACAV